MNSVSVKELLEREFSPDIVTRLLNVIVLNSFEDLVRNYYRTCELKEIYDSLFNILFHHTRFKQNKERFCCLCIRTDKTKSYDVIDGICPCKLLERHKYNLQVHLESYEGYNKPDYKRFCDQYIVEKI